MGIFPWRSLLFVHQLITDYDYRRDKKSVRTALRTILVLSISSGLGRTESELSNGEPASQTTHTSYA